MTSTRGSLNGIKRFWWVCEHDCRRGQHKCLYAGDGPRARCIKHGAILSPESSLNGLTREQARAKLDEEYA